jgi:hypothetical protein
MPGDPGNPPDGLTYRTVAFQEQSGNTPSVDRGFSANVSINSQSPSAVSYEKLKGLYDSNYRLARLVINLSKYRTSSSLGRDVIDAILATAENAKRAGFHVIPRFCYWFNGPGPSDGTQAMQQGVTDTSLENILRHIDNLGDAGCFDALAGAIAYLEAGFIGAWGEWNKSSNRLGDETSTSERHPKQRQIVVALVGALPKERNITLRYQTDLQGVVRSSPLTKAEAFSGSLISRVGKMHDYFTIDSDSVSFFSQHNLYVPQGGEPIRLNRPRSDCPQVMEELRNFHWSNMNQPGSDFADLWRSGGCYNVIEERLGYRYVVSEAKLPYTLKVGDVLQVTLRMRNEGYGNLYNAHAAQLVLNGVRVPAYVSQDLRHALPTSYGPDIDVTFKARIPNTFATGNYRVHLALPDVLEPSNPNYAVKFSNANMWDNGVNYLGGFVLN